MNNLSQYEIETEMNAQYLISLMKKTDSSRKAVEDLTGEQQITFTKTYLYHQQEEAGDTARTTATATGRVRQNRKRIKISHNKKEKDEQAYENTNNNFKEVDCLEPVSSPAPVFPEEGHDVNNEDDDPDRLPPLPPLDIALPDLSPPSSRLSSSPDGYSIISLAPSQDNDKQEEEELASISSALVVEGEKVRWRLKDTAFSAYHSSSLPSSVPRRLSPAQDHEHWCSLESTCSASSRRSAVTRMHRRTADEDLCHMNSSSIAPPPHLKPTSLSLSEKEESPPASTAALLLDDSTISSNEEKVEVKNSYGRMGYTRDSMPLNNRSDVAGREAYRLKFIDNASQDSNAWACTQLTSNNESSNQHHPCSCCQHHPQHHTSHQVDDERKKPRTHRLPYAAAGTPQRRVPKDSIDLHYENPCFSTSPPPRKDLSMKEDCWRPLEEGDAGLSPFLSSRVDKERLLDMIWCIV